MSYIDSPNVGEDKIKLFVWKNLNRKRLFRCYPNENDTPNCVLFIKDTYRVEYIKKISNNFNNRTE